MTERKRLFKKAWKDKGTIHYENDKVALVGNIYPLRIKDNEKFRIQLEYPYDGITFDPDTIITKINDEKKPVIRYEKIFEPEEQAKLNFPRSRGIEFQVNVIRNG